MSASRFVVYRADIVDDMAERRLQASAISCSSLSPEVVLRIAFGMLRDSVGIPPPKNRTRPRRRSARLSPIILEWEDIVAIVKAMADEKHEGALRIQKALRLADAVEDFLKDSN
jgi:hypothetical protein